MTQETATLQYAIAAYQRGDLDTAASACRALTMPGAQVILARISLDRGDTVGAREILRVLVERAPSLPIAWLYLGATELNLGSPSAAASALQRLVTLQPSSAEAWRNYGVALRAAQRVGDARAALTRAVALAPREFASRLALGQLEFDAGQHAAAEAQAEAVLLQNPRSVLAWVLRGLSRSARGHRRDAIADLSRALDLEPTRGATALQLGWLALGDAQLGLARKCFESALKNQPDLADARSGLATIAERDGRYEDALAHLDAVPPERRDEMNHVVCRTNVERHLGRGDEGLRRLRALLERPGTAHGRILGEHAVGAALEARGDLDAAFAAHARANAVGGSAFDLAGHVRYVERTIAAASAPHARSTQTSARPLFIVGMPRSGTTLLERILSRHPEVAAGGEMHLVEGIAVVLAQERQWRERLPDAVARADTAALDGVAVKYLAALDGVSRDARRVTDKNPLNFQHLRLLAQLFPGARVIHCARDPLDTCLSCLFQNFGPALSFTNDQRALGGFYRQYRRLMDDWEAAPGLPTITARYADVVRRPRETIGELLAFCGLSWHEDCLTPQRARLRPHGLVCAGAAPALRDVDREGAAVHLPPGAARRGAGSGSARAIA